MEIEQFAQQRYLYCLDFLKAIPIYLYICRGKKIRRHWRGINTPFDPYY